MGEDNRTNNGRVNNRNNRVNNRPGGRPNSGSGSRPSGRKSSGRSLQDYSVDMAAQRGVVRDDRAERRNRKPGDVKVASVSGNTRGRSSGGAVHGETTRIAHSDEQGRKSRNVDVAATRRKSGKVDVETGRRLDGRVRVPVDRRRIQAPDDDRRNTSAKRREVEGDRRNANAKRRETEGDRRNANSKRRNAEGDRRNTSAKRRETEGDRRNTSAKRRNAEEERRKKTVKHRTQEDVHRKAPVKRKPKKVKRKPTEQEIELRKKLKQERLERRKKRREKAVKVLKAFLRVLLVVIILAVIAFAVINSCYKLKKVNVSGTDHYTDQQVEDIVSGGKKISNTLFFILNNRINPPGDVTFIDKIDVSYVDRNTVSVTVYEKAMAGCIQDGDKYAYFDGDGIVLEISDKKLDDVPCIEGLTSDSIEQGKKLSVGDNSFFQEILTMTQLIYKNNIQIDKITYDDKQNLILHKDGIQIKIGNADNLESKFMNLENILSTLKGKKGTLDMSNYSASDGSVIFKENK